MQYKLFKYLIYKFIKLLFCKSEEVHFNKKRGIKGHFREIPGQKYLKKRNEIILLGQSNNPLWEKA